MACQSYSVRTFLIPCVRGIHRAQVTPQLFISDGHALSPDYGSSTCYIRRCLLATHVNTAQRHNATATDFATSRFSAWCTHDEHFSMRHKNIARLQTHVTRVLEERQDLRGQDVTGNSLICTAVTRLLR